MKINKENAFKFLSHALENATHAFEFFQQKYLFVCDLMNKMISYLYNFK